MKGYITTTGQYYEGAEALRKEDKEVPLRPSDIYKWDGSEWRYSTDSLSARDARELRDISRSSILLLENKYEGLRASLEEIKTSLLGVNDKLNRISIIDERFNTQAEVVEKTSRFIDKLADRVSVLESANSGSTQIISDIKDKLISLDGKLNGIDSKISTLEKTALPLDDFESIKKATIYNTSEIEKWKNRGVGGWALIVCAVALFGAYINNSIKVVSEIPMKLFMVEKEVEDIRDSVQRLQDRRSR